MNLISYDSFYYDNPSKSIDLKDNFFIEKNKPEPEYVDNININCLSNIMTCILPDEVEIYPQRYFKTSPPKSKSNKRGRKKFGTKAISEIKHGKFGSDIIREKIKRRFIQSIKNYLNSLYNKYFNKKKGKSHNFLEKIKTKFTSHLARDKNLEYFSMTLREFFSSDLSGKYTKMDKKYNKKNIDILIKENKEKEIIKLLNKTLEEVYEIYINKEIPEFSLEHDLNIIEKKDGNYYKNRYKEIALKLIRYLKKGKDDSLNIEEVDETSNK